MGGEFELAWSTFEILAFLGVTIGLVLAIVFGFIKLGLQYAPYIAIIALIVWFFS